MKLTLCLRPCLISAITFSVVSTTATAETAFGEETFRARMGGYFSIFDTNVRLSGPKDGDSINLEDTVGLDSDQTVFRGLLAWRPAPRHHVELGYLDIRRNSMGTADHSFTVETEDGTYVFDAGSTLETNFDWQLVPFTYSYSFYKTDEIEIAAALGVHWFNTEVGFSGRATVTPPGGSPTPVASATAVESASGPLPVFGVKAAYAISKKWMLGAKAGWFGLDYDDYSGELVDLGLTTEYWFTDYFGAGLGYTYYAIDITKSEDEYNLGADYTYQGLNAYITARY